MTIPTHYHYQTVEDVDVFYREAGPADGPVLLMLHGFPSSSHQFRNIIPLLATHFRVIAPDLPGFGSTRAPARGVYEYSFDNLANTIGDFVEALDLQQFALFFFDYGAPVGFRLATRFTDRVTGIVSQNGNAYEEGLTEAWAPIRAYWEEDTPANREALRPLLSLETTTWQYHEGVPDTCVERISPDSIAHDQAILDRDAEIQLDLFRDYRTNVAHYPEWQTWLIENQPPLLAIWGRRDPFFAPEGANAFRKDVPNADVYLLETGHFALETHGEEVAQRVLGFFQQDTALADAA